MKEKQLTKRQRVQSKYDSTRVKITVSLNKKEQEAMLNKFGKILSSPEAKEVIFKKNITYKNTYSSPELSKCLTELKRVGVNFNQQTKLANAQNRVSEIAILETVKLELREIMRTVHADILKLRS